MANTTLTKEQIDSMFANKARKRDYDIKIRRDTARSLLVALSGGKCKKCGSTDHLEFHHVFRDGDSKITLGVVLGWGVIDRIVEEYNKCILLCLKCHRAEHKRMRTRYKKKVTTKGVTNG